MKHLVLLLLILVIIGSISTLSQEVKIPLPEVVVARIGTGCIGDVKYSLDGEYISVATPLGVSCATRIP